MAKDFNQEQALARYEELVKRAYERDEDDEESEEAEQEAEERERLRARAAKAGLAFVLGPKPERVYSFAPKQDVETALRHAGLCAGFMWQDDENIDGDVSVDQAWVCGKLPDARKYVTRVEGTAESGFGYSYPIHRNLTISWQENGEPLASASTDEEVALFEEEDAGPVILSNGPPVSTPLEEE